MPENHAADHAMNPHALVKRMAFVKIEAVERGADRVALKGEGVDIVVGHGFSRCCLRHHGAYLAHVGDQFHSSYLPLFRTEATSAIVKKAGTERWRWLQSSRLISADIGNGISSMYRNGSG
jgi:hypothetical protein